MDHPRLIAWATGKDWSKWHITLGQDWDPLCRETIPDAARCCDSRSYETIRKLDSLCRNCLAVYSGTADPKETA